jgi:hypothetical protein
MANRHRHGQDPDSQAVNADPSAVQGYVYEYTLEELNERKQALQKEIVWIEDRIRELEGKETSGQITAGDMDNQSAGSQTNK